MNFISLKLKHFDQLTDYAALSVLRIVDGSALKDPNKLELVQ